MDLSIIVPAYNEEKLLPSTLQAMREAASSVTDLEWELIVCDNNSTDRTALIAAEYGTVVHEPINQIGRARNTGAAAAQGEWLVFIDADSWPSAALMNDLRAAMQDATILYGGAELTMENVGRSPLWALGMWHRLAQWRGWAAGSFLFVRAAAFREIGGFSSGLFAGEELDLCTRLRSLADSRGQRFAFLRKHPLVTSARKLKFYSTAYHMRLIFRTIFTAGRNLRHRKCCDLWYDGQR